MHELLWTGRCRVYYNAKEEAPFVWSVDDGELANEYKVRSVKLLGPIFCTMERNEHDPIQPKVWLDCLSCSVYMDVERNITVAYK